MCTGERSLYAHGEIIPSLVIMNSVIYHEDYVMNNIIYLVGLIVIVIAILKFAGII